MKGEGVKGEGEGVKCEGVKGEGVKCEGVSWMMMSNVGSDKSSSQQVVDLSDQLH